MRTPNSEFFLARDAVSAISRGGVIEHVEGDLPKQGEILSAVLPGDCASALAKGSFEHPVQLVLDVPSEGRVYKRSAGSGRGGSHMNNEHDIAGVKEGDVLMRRTGLSSNRNNNRPDNRNNNIGLRCAKTVASLHPREIEA